MPEEISVVSAVRVKPRGTTMSAFARTLNLTCYLRILWFSGSCSKLLLFVGFRRGGKPPLRSFVDMRGILSLSARLGARSKCPARLSLFVFSPGHRGIAAAWSYLAAAGRKGASPPHGYIPQVLAC